MWRKILGTDCWFVRLFRNPNLWRSDQGYACGCAAWPSRGYKWSVCGLWSIVYGWMNHWLWQGVSSTVEEWFESLTWLKCEIILVGPNIILVSAMLDWTDGLMRLWTACAGKVRGYRILRKTLDGYTLVYTRSNFRLQKIIPVAADCLINLQLHYTCPSTTAKIYTRAACSRCS